LSYPIPGLKVAVFFEMKYLKNGTR